MDFDCEHFGMDSSRAGSEDPGSDPDETFLREMAGLTQKFSFNPLHVEKVLSSFFIIFGLKETKLSIIVSGEQIITLQ